MIPGGRQVHRYRISPMMEKKKMTIGQPIFKASLTLLLAVTSSNSTQKPATKPKPYQGMTKMGLPRIEKRSEVTFFSFAPCNPGAAPNCVTVVPVLPQVAPCQTRASWLGTTDDGRSCAGCVSS